MNEHKKAGVVEFEYGYDDKYEELHQGRCCRYCTRDERGKQLGWTFYALTTEKQLY